MVRTPLRREVNVELTLDAANMKFNNEHGELGTGSSDESSKMISLDLKNEPVEISILRDVVEISAGNAHAMAVTSDGGIWAWGENDEGQLGDFYENKRPVPQRIM